MRLLGLQITARARPSEEYHIHAVHVQGTLEEGHTVKIYERNMHDMGRNLRDDQHPIFDKIRSKVVYMCSLGHNQ